MGNEHDAAVAALNEAAERDPRSCTFGYFARDDFPAGAGLFFWFSTKEELLRAIVELEPRVYEADPEFSSKLASVVGEIREQEISQVVLNQINLVAKNTFEIPWWGTFEELRSGSSQWAQDLREQFRELSFDEVDEDPSSAAIEDHEIESFVSFLGQYGH